VNPWNYCKEGLKVYRKALLLILPLLLISVGLTAKVVEEKEYSLSLEAAEVLVIEGHREGVIKVEGTDTKKVQVRGHLEVYGDDQEHIRQFYEGVELEGEIIEGQTLIRIIRPDLMLPGVEHALFLEVEIPREMDLELQTGASRVEIRNINGHIRLEGSGATLLIEEGTGNIDARGLKGGLIRNFCGEMIRLETEQEVELEGVEGNIEQKIISSQQ